MRARSIAVATVLGMVLAACGGALPEAAGPSEGIQVHGDWTIEVYNEDGTLDRRVEFSNAFLSTGAHILTRLLTGDASASGDWSVRVGSHSVAICPSDVVGFCRFTTTATAVDTGGSGLFDTVRLSGSVIVEADGEIAEVSTNPGICGGNQAPDSCPAVAGQYPFTSKVLFPLETVTAGQTVQVQVDISFTSS
jgi:hypothetical protein